jgi:simple sugar transport system ATP-binding protein
MDGKIVVDMRNIDKVYPNGVVANSKINFQVEAGEIHALMGKTVRENQP